MAFSSKKDRGQHDQQAEIDELYRQLGQVVAEGDWLKNCDQAWSTDITYIRLAHGFVYLMAVIDWYSRYVLGWAISTTLETDFCIEAVGELLDSGSCEIFNTDQGAQFTTPRFTGSLLGKGIRVSMDGRGRANTYISPQTIGHLLLCILQEGRMDKSRQVFINPMLS